MRIKVINKAKGVWPRNLQYLVMNAVGYAMDYYKIRDNSNKLEVKFACYNDERANMGGAAYKLADNRFLIQINIHPYDDWKDLISAVMHEMTHVKQFICQGFDSNFDGDAVVVMWKDEEYFFDSQDVLESASNLVPWEREAYDIEGTMADNFLRNL